MPRLREADKLRDDADRLRAGMDGDLAAFADRLDLLRILLRRVLPDLAERSELAKLVEIADRPTESEARQQKGADWDPIDLVAPEWLYLQKDPVRELHADARSGLTVSPRVRSNALPGSISRVLAVDRLRKVNNVIGFTRLDELDRVNDLTSRLVPLNRSRYPTWAVATEDRGEGIFLQLTESAVASWEQRVVDSDLRVAHKAAHRRNF